MKDKIGDRQRLFHIIDAINEIDDYTSTVEFAEFSKNAMMRFASVKQIEIIGEAANLITPEVRYKYKEIEWRQIIGLRHILVHEYFGIDFDLIWQIIKKDIPALKKEVIKMLKLIDE